LPRLATNQGERGKKKKKKKGRKREGNPAYRLPTSLHFPVIFPHFVREEEKRGKNGKEKKKGGASVDWLLGLPYRTEKKKKKKGKKKKREKKKKTKGGKKNEEKV